MISLKLVRQFVVAVALMAIGLAAAPARSFAQFAIAISVHTAPPPLPVYVQPALPAEGYIWTPGYWAYSDEAGYYWVPGVWVQPPTVGVYWTPAWWGFEGGVYGFHPGYWGPHVGYYGGINYGFGYTGVGFGGGLWVGGRFSYNSVVCNFGGVHVTNIYVNRTVINTTVVNHASFNGPGGWNARPRPEELQYAHERHIEPTAMQQQHFQTAASTPGQRFSANGGRPSVTAARSPEAFHQQAAVASRGAEARPAATSRGGFGNAPAARPQENGGRPQGQPARPQGQPARPQAQPARPAAQPHAQAVPRESHAAPKSNEKEKK
jgi:hypothetical protein